MQYGIVLAQSFEIELRQLHGRDCRVRSSAANAVTGKKARSGPESGFFGAPARSVRRRDGWVRKRAAATVRD